MKHIMIISSIILTFITLSPLYSKELVVKLRPFVEKNIDVTKEYKYLLLDLILSKTEETDGPYRIELSTQEQVQSRTILQIMDDKISLIIAMTSAEREKALHPIRIPVYKGLIGYRIFVINREDKAKFEAIHSLDDLRKLTAGQGHDWPDTDILKHNGLPVMTSWRYRSLFTMLTLKRFDYFPRGVTEPWRELEEEKDLDLIVDKNIMIYYPAPFYIFISKDNHELIDRINRGFLMIIEDGSFDRLFYSHPYIQEAINRAGMQKRLVFRFENPLLSPETPLDKKEYWFVP